MILAILERTEVIPGAEPFHRRYHLMTDFKEIFEDLGVLLFPVVSTGGAEEVERLCDGLVLTGFGPNVHPHYYGREPEEGLVYTVDEYALDKAVIGPFAAAGKPILGVCGGVQSMNVWFGGTLRQQVPNHSLKGGTHPVGIARGSFLESVFGERAQVNSFHGQAVEIPAPGFAVTARAEDGTIEAIEQGNRIGVQWHPEVMRDTAFFRAFLERFFPGYARTGG